MEYELCLSCNYCEIFYLFMSQSCLALLWTQYCTLNWPLRLSDDCPWIMNQTNQSINNTHHTRTRKDMPQQQLQSIRSIHTPPIRCHHPHHKKFIIINTNTNTTLPPSTNLHTRRKHMLHLPSRKIPCRMPRVR